ncbi:MAG: SurA N-terminal domain-containing protein [Betaproteobacteria bacterium]|nr:SurA N-terminal domain-containing protein [Betaproteobacteria bacterium]
MYDFVYKHKRWLQIALLVLIVPPFALFGIDFYFRNTDTGGSLARIGDTRISEVEYSQALRQAQEKMREMTRNNPDPSLLNSPQLRESVLNELIERKVTLSHVAKAGMTISDAELQGMIAAVEAFHDQSGKFSRERYRQLLQGQGLTPAMFENQARTNIMLEQVRSVYSGSAFIPDSVADRLLKIREQEREVGQVVFNPANYRRQVKISDADAEKYYAEHKGEFLVPERVRIEFVVLSLEAYQRSIQVSDEEIKKFYLENQSRFQTPEERRASHILIPAAATASPEEKAKAKAQAEDLLKQAKANPKKFGELAAKFSKDPGSAEKGGDLGFFGRGLMVKPFDEAAFSMKVGDIAGPVETQYGYHIIRLDAIKSMQSTPLEAVKAQIEVEVRKPKAGKAFAEAADNFNNLVYEQFDSLQPTVDALKLILQKSDWVSRAGGNPNPLLNNDKLLAALFSDEVLKNKHNTSAIEIQPNMLLAARVIEHKPSEGLPLDQVRKDILQHLADQAATQLAEKEGRAALDKLKKGEPVALAWSAEQTVTLQKRQGLHPEAAQSVFGADTAKLPAYTGVPVSQGRFVIYRVTKVKDVTDANPEQRKALAKQLTQMIGQEQYIAYLASLRERADVKVDKKKLDQGS